MKKVVYSVTRYVKGELEKISGLGFITDTDLIVACMSKAGKPYIRVFDDCVKNCPEIIGKPGEHKGAHYEIREIEVTKDDGSKDTREVELNYKIWFKFVEER